MKKDKAEEVCKEIVSLLCGNTVMESCHVLAIVLYAILKEHNELE